MSFLNQGTPQGRQMSTINQCSIHKKASKEEEEEREEGDNHLEKSLSKKEKRKRKERVLLS